LVPEVAESVVSGCRALFGAEDQIDGGITGPSPGIQMTGGFKTAHIDTDLGDDYLCGVS